MEEDLVNLPKYEFYIKLMIDGVSSDPFSARGLPPLTGEEKTNNKEKVIKVSRERYAKQKFLVEERILRWHTNNESGAEKDEKTREKKSAEENVRKKIEIKEPFSGLAGQLREVLEKKEGHQPDQRKYDVVCNRCGKATQVSFAPDGIRPIFCQECLLAVKNEKRQEAESRKEAKKQELAGLKEK